MSAWQFLSRNTIPLNLSPFIQVRQDCKRKWFNHHREQWQQLHKHLLANFKKHKITVSVQRTSLHCIHQYWWWLHDFISDFITLCGYEHFAYMHMCAPHVCLILKEETSEWQTVKSLYRYWWWNPGPLQGQQVLFIFLEKKSILHVVRSKSAALTTQQEEFKFKGYIVREALLETF